MLVTLDMVIKESPEDWNGAEYCPDTDFIKELWGWYLDCETKFATKLKTVTKAKNLAKQ